MKKTALMIWGNPRRLFPAVYGICHLLPWRKRPHLPKVFNPVEAELMDFQGTCFSPWFFFSIPKPCSLVDHRIQFITVNCEIYHSFEKIQ